MTPGDDDQRSEQDVEDDNKVAASRAGKDGDEDGSYVGQTFNDDSLDTGETGAEARSEGGG
ncbi:hypothetical protein [Mycobacterium sp. IDR2000157661]|uniref:hypothetical protein n=1 Tax=Mycobacterium sp. IDR2000157661 TaxID=2867005 RepID=UPI001EED3D96|nr:hypothetical protein [Mycobacterium sp. IDR2000157661]ULE35871.1 hypothetical protein K3G64_20580 [Mycobacterium sp. IDR2000157661]